MKPALENGRPVAASVDIPIAFTWTGPAAGHSTPQFEVADPIWDAAPTFADMAAAWPKRSKAASAHVSMLCKVNSTGGLKDCDVLTETPFAGGFGGVAKDVLAPKFRLRLDPNNKTGLDKTSVRVAVHFVNPASGDVRSVTDPRWITTVDADKVQALYPAKAADAGVKTGKGVAECVVAANGQLQDCKPVRAEPEGLGFAEATVQVASVMQMNPWSDGGGPVDGAHIRLPVVFNLAPDDAPPPAKPLGGR